MACIEVNLIHFTSRIFRDPEITYESKGERQFVIFLDESSTRASYLIETLGRNQLLWESPLVMITDAIGTPIMLFPDLQGSEPFLQIPSSLLRTSLMTYLMMKVV